MLNRCSAPWNSIDSKCSRFDPVLPAGRPSCKGSVTHRLPAPAQNGATRRRRSAARSADGLPHGPQGVKRPAPHARRNVQDRSAFQRFYELALSYPSVRRYRSLGRDGLRTPIGSEGRKRQASSLSGFAASVSPSFSAKLSERLSRVTCTSTGIGQHLGLGIEPHGVALDQLRAFDRGCASEGELLKPRPVRLACDWMRA